MTARPVGRGGLGALAARLTPRDRWLLRMLHEHTVLTTTQLHRLGWATTLRQVQGRTRTLRGYEVLDGFRPLRPYGHGSEPLHLLLGPAGAQVLAAEAGLTVAELGYRGRTRALTVAHRLTLAHDVGAADLICDLAATPTVELVRWWSARRCGRYFGHHTRPDAYLTLTTRPWGTGSGWAGSGWAGAGVGWWEMFLEYDTGSENLTQLTAKISGYHALAEDSGVITPLGVWFTRPGREPSARRALTDALQALPTPARVPILTGAPHTADTSHTADARTSTRRTAALGARVWLPLHPGRVERVDLASLATDRPQPLPAAASGSGSDPAGPLPAPYPYPPPGRGRS